jgi:hypothetical protein
MWEIVLGPVFLCASELRSGEYCLKIELTKQSLNGLFWGIVFLFLEILVFLSSLKV